MARRNRPTTPPTQNPEWGFWGTWSRRQGSTPTSTKAAWETALLAMEAAGFTLEQARLVLDSRVGRHMADQVDGDIPAVTSTVARLASIPGWRKEMNEAAGLPPPKTARAKRLLKEAREALRALALEVEHDDAEDMVCEALDRLDKVEGLLG
jgi:hypothetical protein